MRDMMLKVADSLCRGEELMMCSIISDNGSAPRGIGAKMVVMSDGSLLGTLGGGAVEHESIKIATRCLEDKTSFVKDFSLSEGTINGIGMICGGSVEILFHYIDGKCDNLRKLFVNSKELFEREVASWMISVINSDGLVDLGLYIRGEGLKYMSGEALPDTTLKRLCRDVPVIERDDKSIYVEPLTKLGRVYVFGAGHVSRALIPVISKIGFRSVVCDDREELLQDDYFPQASKLIRVEYNNIYKNIKLKPYDYVIIMTKGHCGDFEILEQVLKSNVCYIGVIGSKYKVAATNKKLITSGFDYKDLSRIHSPIGMPIMATTPDEIAISVAGELIRHRAIMSDETAQGAGAIQNSIGSNNLELLGRIAKALAEQFGDNCEVVIHDFGKDDNEPKVAIIENGHVTGRSIGDGPSKAVLKAIMGGRTDIKDRLAYQTRTSEGRILKSSTIYIQDNKGIVVGVLGINYDITNMVMMNKIIDGIVGSKSDSDNGNNIKITNNVNELLYDLLEQSESLVGKPVALMDKDDKIKAIKFLNEAGAFLITKSGDKVSQFFGISKYTLYNYIDAK